MTEYAANPLFLFLTVWGATIALYLAGVVAGLFSPPQALTVGVLSLNIGTFSLGYLTWALLKGLPPQGVAPPRVDIKPLTPERIQRALSFTLLMGGIALLLMLYRVAVIAAGSGSGVGGLAVGWKVGLSVLPAGT